MSDQVPNDMPMPTIRTKRRTLAFLLAGCWVVNVLPTSAQPSPCGPDADMTPTCLEACVVCDINGFTGINSDPDPGEAPPGFCTTTAHHMQWIAFIAGSEDLSISVKPTNCTNGFGLEVGIYESLDCESFNLVSNCDGDISPGQTGIFQNITPLVIGQYYYFVMDGNNGDICQYTIQVLEGSTLVPPLPAAEPVEGPSVVCRDSSASFNIPPVTGANFYDWTLDGIPAGEGATADILFTGAGTHQLCVTAYNVCDTVAPACMQVTVVAPQTTALTVGLCEGDCTTVGGTTFCQPGTYVIPLQGYLGCDSTILLTVEMLPVVETDISAYICSVDSLLVGNQWYSPPGQYQVVLPTYNGCDSIIHLDLQAVICEITGSASTTPVTCQGHADGTLSFQVLQGTPPFSYTWERLGGTPAGSGNLSGTGMPATLGGLPAGVYLIAIQDTFGNDVVLNTLVSAPPPLAVELTGSDYLGYGVRCAGGMDGTLSVQASGGTPGYSFLWQNGQQTASVSELTAGDYSVTVTDANGCTATAVLSLQAPPPLSLSAAFIPPNCSGTTSGQAEILSVTGGVPPYQYGLDGLATGPVGLFEGLGGGTHTLLATDANGCQADSTAILPAVEIPFLQLPSPVELLLGYSEPLPPSLNLLPANIQWSPATGLSCTDCLTPDAAPVESTWYTLMVSSADGCTATDSTFVRVVKVRKVFPPNVFSPDGDGVNDRFTLFGDRGLRQIRSLQVFSRWGESVFDQQDLPPNDPAYGWDGTFRGKPMMPGVYRWDAVLEFLDGVVLEFEGDLTLVR
ncbi:MAG: hypothetical protein RLY31_669 [Bacteroidota bacterium]|jgi:gliding motility-associated-like protein